MNTDTNTIDDGGPAFPGSAHGYVPQRGMTLRDWFAGKALSSMLSSPSQIKDDTYDLAAQLSYKFADAMLAARKQS